MRALVMPVPLTLVHPIQVLPIQEPQMLVVLMLVVPMRALLTQVPPTPARLIQAPLMGELQMLEVNSHPLTLMPAALSMRVSQMEA